MLAVNGLSNSQVAVILSVDFVERTLFVLGLESAALEVDPFIQGMALGLKVVPIRLVAPDLVGEQSGVEAQHAGLEFAGDAKAFELSLCESAAQSAKSFHAVAADHPISTINATIEGAKQRQGDDGEEGSCAGTSDVVAERDRSTSVALARTSCEPLASHRE